MFVLEFKINDYCYHKYCTYCYYTVTIVMSITITGVLNIDRYLLQRWHQSDTVYRSLLMPGGVYKQKVLKFNNLLHLAGGAGGKAGRQRHHCCGDCHPSPPRSGGHCH